MTLVCSPAKQRDMKRGRFAEEQIAGILKAHLAGVSASERCRKHGSGDTTLRNRRSRCGGMEVSEAKRLKQPNDENAKLKRLLAERMMDVATPREMPGKRPLRPSSGGSAEIRAMSEKGWPQRRACRLTGTNLHVHRCRCSRPDDDGLRTRLRERSDWRCRIG